MSGKNQGQLQKPIQTIKGKVKSEPPNKRSFSEVSNESVGDITAINIHLDEITGEISKLREIVMKKEDIEHLISATVTAIMKTLEVKMHKEITDQIKEQCKQLHDQIDSLEFEKKQLKDELKSTTQKYQKQIDDLRDRAQCNETRSTEAIKMSNYNEQYSRKTNFKMMAVKEERGETEMRLVEKVDEILKREGAEISRDEILAIHRIPTRGGGIRPVIVKTINNSVKTRVMRKRKELRTSGHRVTDDVTRLNTALINRLYLNDQIETAWFFNGSVFGQTHEKERVKFDIYDDISENIADYRLRRNQK